MVMQRPGASANHGARYMKERPEPDSMPPQVGAVILAESGLAFLGLGVPPPAPTWGGMLSGSGRSYMYLAPWLALAPGLCITIVVYAINVFGDALRDLLDPRMRGSR